MHINLPGGKQIGDDRPCFVVAELGQNHQGDSYTAVRLMKAAADAGCDAVKLCKRDIRSELTAEAFNRPYVGPQSFGKTYGEHRQALELSPDEYRHLKDRVRYNGWPFTLFATACDRQSVDDLVSAIDPPIYKVASRDLDNLPLLDYIGQTGKPTIISAGMAAEGEIDAAIETLRRRNVPIVLMVCTSEYPTPNAHVGLWRLPEWRQKYGVLIGLSDHTAGITAGICGAAIGACVVEKHLTLSRAMKGTDHAASLEPEGMRRMVGKIREVEEMMSRDNGGLVDCTSSTRAKLGRSLVTSRDVPAGEVLATDAICLKSPGDGIPWARRGEVLGRTARRALRADTMIQLSDVMEGCRVPG